MRRSARPHGRPAGGPFATADAVVADRHADANAFYALVVPEGTSEDRLIARRAFAGLMWCKQLYRYYVEEWLDGDPARTPTAGAAGAPAGRPKHRVEQP